MTGLIIGIMVGTVLAVMGGVWLTQKNEHAFIESLENEEQKTNLEKQTYPLEQKLRNAIYNCERDAKKCADKINEICGYQLDLLEDIGEISHVEVKNKPLFVEFYNPMTKQRHFYYQRDLFQHIEATVLEKTKKIANKYKEEIDLLNTQRQFFIELIDSHKENLNRLGNIENEDSQLSKINLHQEKLSELNSTNKIEENAIYNELLINEINEELAHQEECMRQYIALHKKYEQPSDEKVEEKYKLEIEKIISQLEAKNPKG